MSNKGDITLIAYHLDTAVQTLIKSASTPQNVIVENNLFKLKETIRTHYKTGIIIFFDAEEDDNFLDLLADPKPNVLTIALSNHNDSLNRENCLKKGADIALHTPLTETDLKSKIDIFLNYIKTVIQVGPINSVDSAKILLVDDEAANLESMQFFLDDYELYIAKSGQEAVGQLKNQPDIDLILLDIGLPDGSGLQWAIELKKIAKEPPIIIVTGHSDSKSKADISNCSVYHTLFKPYLSTELKKCVAFALKHVRGRSKITAGIEASKTDLK